MFESSLEAMFTSVAEKYDLVNSFLTFGLDGIWREACARECARGQVVVDLCCGTGELSSRILKHLAPDSCMIGLDFNKMMLASAVDKTSSAKQRKQRAATSLGKVAALNSDPSFILADAAHLPLKDECVDRMGISFSFRNLVYKNPKTKQYLKEALRVLRLGGRFVCVETSQPDSRLLRAVFQLYCLRIVPLIGWLVTRQRDAYRYLGVSAANFLSAEKLSAMLVNDGFRKVSFVHYTFGAVGLHVATK
jgi:demethylmenaquinone methyltransferase/2-methoxy-6-polyprenyl-1,4-benzoquinol methylase